MAWDELISENTAKSSIIDLGSSQILENEHCLLSEINTGNVTRYLQIVREGMKQNHKINIFISITIKLLCTMITYLASSWTPKKQKIELKMVLSLHPFRRYAEAHE